MPCSLLTRTTPPQSCTWLAPVGQQATQGGRSQWLQRSLRILRSRVGKLPESCWVTQSRCMSSGVWFSVLQATTQSWQPTHRRVSITIPSRAMASGLPLERHEGDVHARAAHQRIGDVPRDETGVARSAAEGPAQHLRSVAEPVDHVDTVAANGLGGADLDRVADGAVLTA